jgi:uncharacterized membrane protein YgaE (UPF0421/DUF939 family)
MKVIIVLSGLIVANAISAQNNFFSAVCNKQISESKTIIECVAGRFSTKDYASSQLKELQKILLNLKEKNPSLTLDTALEEVKKKFEDNKSLMQRARFTPEAFEKIKEEQQSYQLLIEVLQDMKMNNAPQNVTIDQVIDLLKI